MSGETVVKQLDAKSFDNYLRERVQEIRRMGRVEPVSRIFLNEWKITRRQDSQSRIACLARNLEEAKKIMGVDSRWILRISRRQWTEIKRCLNG